MEEEMKEETESVDPLKEATHHSKLEPKNLKVYCCKVVEVTIQLNLFFFCLQFSELKSELEARNLSSKGMRTQLIPRLTIALKGEAEEEKRKRDEEASAEEQPSREDSPSGEESDSIRRLDFVASPQILVHPSRTAKGGKFSCSLVSLSVLLDYRPEDTKVCNLVLKLWNTSVKSNPFKHRNTHLKSHYFRNYSTKC